MKAVSTQKCNTEDCENPTTVYCENCTGENDKPGVYYCDSCNETAHKRRVFQNHNRIEEWKISNIEKVFEMSNNPEKEMQVDKDSNCIVSVDFHDGKLCLEETFYELLEPLDENIQPSFISVLGSTGVGKSTLIRIILKTLGQSNGSLPAPIIGARDCADSTSSDLHFYIGPVITPPASGKGTNNNNSAPSTPKVMKDGIPLGGGGINPNLNIQSLLFDTEGLDGTDIPKTLLSKLGSKRNKLQLLRQSSPLTPYTTRQASQVVAYRARRRNHVEQTYPKLVYLFSDVILYVTDANWKNKSFLDRLIAWASQGSANSVNQSVKPKLIVIFNKVDPTTFEEYQREFPNPDFLAPEYWQSDPERAEGIFKFFQNPQIIFIPHSNHLIKVSEQIQRLNGSIITALNDVRDVRFRSLQLFNLQSFKLCFKNALDCFNKGLSFDFRYFITGNDVDDLAAHLISLYRRANRKYGIEKALRIFKRRAMLSTVLLFRKNGFACGPGASLAGQWRDFLNDLSEKCTQEFPCVAQRVFECRSKGQFKVTCEAIRRLHFAGHQSSQTYEVKRTWAQWWEGDCAATFACRWKGDYEAPNVDVDIIAQTEEYVQKLDTVFDKERVSARVFDDIVGNREEILQLIDQKTNVCFSCFSTTKTEKIDCGHSFCLSCCKMMKTFHNSKCMFCDKPMNWRDLRLAGYRLLVLKGQGVQSIVDLFLLKKIEDFLKIPICYLFDCVMGDNLGAIIAAYLSVKSDSGRALISAPSQAEKNGKYECRGLREMYKEISIGLESAYRLSFASRLLKNQVPNFDKTNEIAVTSFSLLLTMMCAHPVYFYDWAKFNFDTEVLGSENHVLKFDLSLTESVMKTIENDLANNPNEKKIENDSPPPPLSTETSDNTSKTAGEDEASNDASPSKGPETERPSEQETERPSEEPRVLHPVPAAEPEKQKKEKPKIKVCDAICAVVLKEDLKSEANNGIDSKVNEKLLELSRAKKAKDIVLSFGQESSSLLKIPLDELELKHSSRPTLLMEVIEKEVDAFFNSNKSNTYEFLKLSANLLGCFFYSELTQISENHTGITIQIKTRHSLPLSIQETIGNIRLKIGVPVGEPISASSDIFDADYIIKKPRFDGSGRYQVEFEFETSLEMFPVYLYGDIEINFLMDDVKFHEYVQISGIPIRIPKNDT